MYHSSSSVFMTEKALKDAINHHESTKLESRQTAETGVLQLHDLSQ